MSISTTFSNGGDRSKLNLRFNDPIPDGMHVYEGDVEVAGISHRKAQVIAFAKRQQHSLELEREPNNRHDPNAIKVFGRAKGWFFWGRFFLGYLPKETAARIARDGLWGQVSPRLRNIWWGGYVQDFLVVRLEVIAPKPEKPAKAKRRKK